MLLEGGVHEGASTATGEHRLGTKLDDAGACGVRQRQQAGEVEVVGEDDASFPSSPFQDGLIGRFRVSHLAPVDRREPPNL